MAIGFKYRFTAGVSWLAAAAMALTGIGMAGVVPTVQAATGANVTAQIESVRADSIDQNTENHGQGGSAQFAIDGDTNTYWHTKWNGGVDPLPHFLEARFSSPQPLSRVVLTPRQSSGGSGRVHEYEILGSPTCYEGADFNADEVNSWEVLATGESAEEANRREDLVVDIPANKVTAVKCFAVKYKSAWGGAAGHAETVGSLAELHAWTGTSVPEEENPPVNPAVPSAGLPENMTAVPDDALSLTQGDLTVKFFANHPAVIQYALGAKTMRGVYGEPENKILIGKLQDGRFSASSHDFTVGTVTHTADKITYPLTVAGLDGVTMDVVYTLDDGALKMSVENVQDPNSLVHTFSFPTPLVSVDSSDAAAQLSAANVIVDRNRSGDHFEKLSETAPYNSKTSWMAIANTSQLAAGLEGTMTEDKGNSGSSNGDVRRFNRQIKDVNGTKVGTITPHMWVYRARGSELGIGPDDQLWVKVKVVADANGDGTVDWQDGAIATRDVYATPVGADEVPNRVISRIPFNIVSQATHPFLRTLDDTKRISLATDNLGQQVLLKGYQAEGHDSAHPDYGGHYNVRAGGLDDLKTLVTKGKEWNSTFGVHINAKETYSEAKHFGDSLVQPPTKAWNWMNQSYLIDYSKDLGSRNLINRLDQFRAEVPDNLSWLYFDTHFPWGWQNTRMVEEMNKLKDNQGRAKWKVSSEWAASIVHDTIWSHWAQDEGYGGKKTKGYTSQIMRFVLNSQRDTWNPNPILGTSRIVEFEGWTGQQDYAGFINNVWQRNLPAKFLQQSPIVKWEPKKITFQNGTVATSRRSSLVTNFNASDLLLDRTVTYKGVEVIKRGAYLLPWTDGGPERLYHYNLLGGTTTWNLNPDWASLANVKVYKLTDDGRADEQTVPVTNGQISLPAETHTAYVIYKGDANPVAKPAKWGEGSRLVDPGFYAGNLEAYTTTGNVSVVPNQFHNREAVFGAGASSATQQVALDAGDWNYWAWVEIQKGKTRQVSVKAEGDGVKPTAYQHATNGVPETVITQSSAENLVASDEKHNSDGNSGWQRVRVTFHLDAPATVTLGVHVGDGDAAVKIDDQRLVKFVAPTDAHPTDQTVFFDDFENVDTGYWPFISGTADTGDARTQLSERHEPYTQHGWDGKPLDNVLDGNWSLMAHQEGGGLILRTVPQSLPILAGHKYRVSFDYQAAFAKNAWTLFAEHANGTGFDRDELKHQDLAATGSTTARFSQEFDAASCSPISMGFIHAAGGAWNDLIIDNFRLEDLGEMDSQPACAILIPSAETMTQGRPGSLDATLTSSEEVAVSNVKLSVEAPAGWTVADKTAAATELAPGASTRHVWNVTPPKGAEHATFHVTASYQVNGVQKSITRPIEVTAVDPATRFLSDFEVPAGSANGWGPIERDRSNGEDGLGDGGPITIKGKAYPKGLGVHANSQVTYQIPEGCTAFEALAGVDDETGRGSVDFTVLTDGEKVFGPVLKRGGDDPAAVKVDLTGKSTLTLKVGNGDGDNGGDHADWAMARFVCPQPEEPTPALDPLKVTVNGTELAAPTAEEPVTISVTEGDTVTADLQHLNAGKYEVAVITEDGSSEVLGEVTGELGEDASFSFPAILEMDGKKISISSGPAVDATFVLKVAKKPAPVEPSLEGTTEGTAEGTTEGSPEGTIEGSPEGTIEGSPEGTIEGSPEGTTEGTAEGSPESPVEISVKAFENKLPIDFFTQGIASNVDLVFTGAPEGSQWNVTLHSEPVALGVVTVKNGHAMLSVTAETTAKLELGKHRLVLTRVGKSQTFSLPWLVKAHPGKDGKHKVSSGHGVIARYTNGMLSNTGVSVTSGATLAALLAIAGAALIRRRKQLD